MTFSKPFSTVPVGAHQQPTPFELHVEEQELQDFKTLLKLSPIAKETYENLQDGGGHGSFGVSRKWMADTKTYWESEYDWRKEEDRINSFPNFKTKITDDDGSAYDMHFVALFSTNKDAIPIALFHGWPGSFLEFLPMMDMIRKKYTPETLPYHIIAPSLPGFAFSSAPPLNKNWRCADTSRLMHKLILSLGFSSTGYLVQGGDIGSYVARQLAANYSECKGMHLNFMIPPAIHAKIQSKSYSVDGLTEADKKGIAGVEAFMATGSSYAFQYATKPSTIGLVLASSPVAQLAWIGEKFLAWSDPRTAPCIDMILAHVTLYWLTGCYPTSIYVYRDQVESPYVESQSDTAANILLCQGRGRRKCVMWWLGKAMRRVDISRRWRRRRRCGKM